MNNGDVLKPRGIGDLECRFAVYLQRILDRFATRAIASAPAENTAPEQVSAQIFDVLRHRENSYLSKKKSEPYRQDICNLLVRNIQAQQPLSFYYDIGGGYHASIKPGEAGLSFDVGLGELLILHQIKGFSDRVAEIYRSGAMFTLVVDNLCALLINDISIEHTQSYTSALRELIAELHLEGTVSVLAESEHFTADEYRQRMQPGSTPDQLTDQDVENVSRFLGRHCSREEAAMRMGRYDTATAVSDEMLAKVIDGVRMTQRASATTFGFRPFPGGDSRIQTGQVALTVSSSDKVKPTLVTSKTIEKYNMDSISDMRLPRSVDRVLLAIPR